MSGNRYREIRATSDGFTENAGSNAQNVNFTDLICEGPIRGLVGGSGGVFFDDVSIEDAALSQFTPPPSTGTGPNSNVSGQITFTGSGASSIGIVNSDVDLTGLELLQSSSRSLTLRYAKTTAALSSVQTISDSEGTEISTNLTFQASSGAPFSSAWNTSVSPNQLNGKARAKVYFFHPELDNAVAGTFEVTDGDTAVFSTFVGDTVFPNTGTYTLELFYTLNVEDIDVTDNEITVTGTPAAGVYPFTLNRQVQYSDPGGDIAPENSGSIGRINGFHVDFRNGSFDQPVVTSTGGVGGSIQVTGTTSGINLTELNMINQSTANTLGFTLFDIDGLPNADGSKTYPGNPDTSVLSSAATVIPSASFGLDTSAKVVEADEIAFTIRYSSLQVINQETGDRDPAYAKYVMEMRFKQNGTFTNFTPLFFGGQVTHSADTNAPISFEHVVSLQGYRELVGPFEDFEVRVSRVTRHIGMPVRWDGTSQGVTNKQKWVLNAKASIESLRAVIKDNLRYPYSAIASISFSSRERASTPKRSYLLEGKLVKVPTTYIPREYSFTGIAKYDNFWDGNFREELLYTDNPAWVFYDLVTNNRYGAGRWVNPSDIDKYALYRIARYCDELVEDGKKYDSTSTLKRGEFYKIYTVGTTDFTSIGAENNTVGTIFRAAGTSIIGTGTACGVEPRFRANVLLTKATEVYKVLKDFATIFLGILYWQNSKLTPVNEAPQEPIYNFTKGNVIDGQFTYESSGSRTRANQVIVTWHDPTSNYEPVPLLVEDRESIVRTGRIISESAVAFGATSEGQAIRYGRWKLWTAQNQTEVLNFKTSLAAHYIKPGDIINVQDADRYGISYSGRTSSATSTTLTFDRSVSFNSGSTYELSTVVTDAAAINSSRQSITIQDNQTPSTSHTYGSGSKVVAAWVYLNNSYTYTTLDSEEKASNAFIDSSGSQLLSLGWKPYTHTESNEIVNPGTASTTVTLANAVTFDTTPSAHNIWALKEISSGINTNASKKMYKVLSIAEEEPNIFGISAVEHYNEKYTAVEEEYELGYIADTIYNSTAPETIPSPRNPRVRLATDATRPGEEFLFEWDDPAEDADEVIRYEVLHTIKNIENPITTTANSVEFQEVVNGSVLLKVRAITRNGTPSRYAALNFVVNDPYGTNIERVQYGIPKGAVTNSEAAITGSTGSEAFTFGRSDFVIASNGAKEVILSPNENSQDISDIPADENYYVFLDADTPTLSLMYYDTESLENMPFWRDAGTGNSAPSTSWTSIGTILIAANDNTVFGTGFNTNVKLRDILNLSGSTSPTTPVSEGAVVISIISDTELIIDRTFESQIATTGYRANYRPDYEQDAAIARVHKDSSNVFTTERFLTLDPDLNSTIRAVTFDLDVQNLTYNSSSVQTNVPSSINATINAVGYRDPEFKIVIPAGMSAAGTQDFASSTGSDPLIQNYELDNNGAVAYNSGAPLTIVASVREKNDPANTVKSSTIVLTKSKDGTNAEDGRVVNLTMGDQTFEYDTAGANPSPSSTTVTATALNTSGTVYYEFIVGQNSVNTDEPTYSYTPPASYANMPEKIEVRIREGSSSSAILARDQITASGLRAGSDAITVILSNEAHTLPTTNTGVVTYTGSGTDIEVWEGTNRVPYDDTSPYASPSFRVAVSSDTGITANPNPTTIDTYIRSYGAHDDMGPNSASIVYSITLKNTAGVESTFTKTQSFSKSIEGDNGVSYTGTTEYYRLTNNTSPPGRYSGGGTTIDTDNWSTDVQTPISTNQYLWNFNRNSRSDSTFTDSAVTLLTQFVEDGRGISSIAEEYQKGPSATSAPTGTWSSTFSGAGELDEDDPYMWNRTTITFTDTTNQVLITLIAARGDNGDPGDPGAPGLRTIQGYLYYEKSQTPGTAPTTTGIGNEYTFSTGLVGGTGIGTGVDTWTNAPRTQDPTSANVHWTVRYYGTEGSANSNTIDVSYSNVVQHTNFSGVVTFNNGTGRFEEGGTPVTTIDGGSIDTGTITANRLTIGNTTVGNTTSTLKLYSDALKIFDSGNIRVKIGNLGNNTDE